MVTNAYDRESDYRDRKEEPDGDIVPSVEPGEPDFDNKAFDALDFAIVDFTPGAAPFPLLW